eukprot:719153-Lingulodinium_polyedra.AAC.1
MADMRGERELSSVACVARARRSQDTGMADMRGERELSSVRRFLQSTPCAVHVRAMGIASRGRWVARRLLPHRAEL